MLNWEDLKILIPERYREGKNVEAFLKSFIQQFSFEENQINKLKLSLQIDTATGQDLEALARVLQIGRELNENDNDFRNRIKTFLGTVSIKTGEQAFEKIIEEVFGVDSSQYTITQEPNKVIIQFVFNGNEEFVDTLQENLNLVKGAGKIVILYIELSLGDLNETIAVDDNIQILDSLDSGIFISDISSVGYTTAVPTTSSYQFGYGTYGISLFDGEDLIY